MNANPVIKIESEEASARLREGMPIDDADMSCRFGRGFCRKIEVLISRLPMKNCRKE
ncbi:MAG: hypothetical protein HC846_07520 [Blastocatellia bacterium]|nr:hypothetical protein [Blastocatellia bacterium]